MELNKVNALRLTENFWLNEFQTRDHGLVSLEPALVLGLQEERTRLGKPIYITSACRTWHDQMRIYRKRYKNWVDCVCLTSKHICGPGFKASDAPGERIATTITERASLEHVDISSSRRTRIVKNLFGSYTSKNS